MAAEMMNILAPSLRPTPVICTPAFACALCPAQTSPKLRRARCPPQFSPFFSVVIRDIDSARQTETRTAACKIWFEDVKMVLMILCA